VQQEAQVPWLNPNHDLDESRPEYAFPQVGGGGRMVPGARQVIGQRHHLGTFCCGQAFVGLVLLRGSDFRLEACDLLQPGIPAALQLGGDRSILGLDRVVLSVRRRP
jgi:hypothetical protein